MKEYYLYYHKSKNIRRALLLLSILQVFLINKLTIPKCGVSSFILQTNKQTITSSFTNLPLSLPSSSHSSYKSFTSTTTPLFISSTLREEKNPNVKIKKQKQQEEQEEQKTLNANNITLVPISLYPIILSSSEPILSKKECEILMNNNVDDEVNNGNAEKIKEKEEIMTKVKSIIDKLTNCPSHDGEKPPRLLKYDSINHKSNVDSNIIPDGLHVDINNGMLFRHLTILLYLTDNNVDTNNLGCATTFPLAMPVKNNEIDNDNNNRLIKAANNLITNEIYHTQIDNQQYKYDTKILEQAAIDLYDKESLLTNTAQKIQKDNNNIINSISSNLGARIIPKAGHLCIFCNRLNNGLPDPLTLHGGESCISSSIDTTVGRRMKDNDHNKANNNNKVVLSFFKEIPTNVFNNFDEFAKNIAFSRQWLIDQYY